MDTALPWLTLTDHHLLVELGQRAREVFFVGYPSLLLRPCQEVPPSRKLRCICEGGGNGLERFPD